MRISIRFYFLIFVFAAAAALSGCLTADTKEVHLSLRPDGKSGSGKILFSGISSSPGDSIATVNEDFNSLIAEYYQGRKIELDNKGMKNVHKRLYVEDGKLMGEITFDFDDVSALGIVQYKNSGPYMFYTVADGFFTSGQYESSNGSYMGDKLPVIFWDATEHDLFYRMALTTAQEPRKSLTSDFEAWQKRQH